MGHLSLAFEGGEGYCSVLRVKSSVHSLGKADMSKGYNTDLSP